MGMLSSGRSPRDGRPPHYAAGRGTGRNSGASSWYPIPGSSPRASPTPYPTLRPSGMEVHHRQPSMTSSLPWPSWSGG
eukprot:7435190-Alexandrium_andersonii.AAC.1